jgi:hypothetical protein
MMASREKKKHTHTTGEKTMSKHAKKVGAKTYRLQFDSITEMVDTVTTKENTAEVNRALWDKEMSKPASNFKNGYTVDQAVRELEEPPKASKEVRGLARELEERFDFEQTVRKRVYRREQGDELCPIAWVQRDMQGWSDIEKIGATKPLIKLGVNLSVNADKRPEQLYPRGACLVALSDILSAQGYSVEVHAILAASELCYDGQPAGAVHVIETRVKAPDAPMDVDGLSLVCSEIGFFRTVGFLSYIQAPAEGKVGIGLGRSTKLPKKFASEYDLIIDADVFTLDAALEKVIGFIDGLGETEDGDKEYL